MSFGAIYGETSNAPVTPSRGGFASIYSGSQSAPLSAAPAPAPTTPQPTAIEKASTEFAPGNPYAASLYDQAAGKNPQMTLPQQIYSDVHQAMGAPSPAKIPITPESYLTDIYGPKGTIGQGGIIGDTIQAWQKAISSGTATLPTDPTQKAAAIGQVGMNALTAFFTPISDVFQKAATIPGPIGDIADAVNKGFNALGAGSGDALAGLLQANKSLSQSQKDSLTPLAKQIGSLAAQIAVGKASGDVFSSLKDTTGTFLDKLSEDSRIQELNNNPVMIDHIAKQTAPAITLNVKSEAPSTSADRYAAYLKSQGYEPITPDNQLPTIEMGPKPKSTEPVIQVGGSTELPAPAGMKVVPEVQTAAPTQVSQKTTAEIAPGATEIPKTTQSAPEVPLPAREPGVTKVASDINNTLVKQGFEALTPEEQSQYTPESYKVIEQEATKLDRSTLNGMATGDIPIPKDLHGHGQILFNMAEALATKEKDGELLSKLADSPLATARSVHAQGLGESGFNANDHGVVKQIKTIEQLREGAVSKRGAKIKTDATARITESIRKTNTVKTWSDFVASLEC
jgi:hypothetical protein